LRVGGHDQYGGGGDDKQNEYVGDEKEHARGTGMNPVGLAAGETGQDDNHEKYECSIELGIYFL